MLVDWLLSPTSLTLTPSAPCSYIKGRKPLPPTLPSTPFIHPLTQNPALSFNVCVFWEVPDHRPKMIFFFEPKWPVATIVLYICIYLPIIQIKGTFLSILGFILCRYHHPFELSDALVDVNSEKMTCSVDLLMTRFGDLKTNEGSNKKVGHDEACSICLVEFEREDLVSLPSKCGHVFHTVCIDKWLERNNFTCPLCRSLLLDGHTGLCCWRPYGVSNPPPNPKKTNFFSLGGFISALQIIQES